MLFICLCMLEVGIVCNCRRLMLVHEPEAAAMTVISRLQDPVPLKEHDTFIIVDAGGGTTDMTCHKVCNTFSSSTLYMRACFTRVL